MPAGRPAFLFSAILLCAATWGQLSAGPLVPPAGPVTSTAKPLAEVEPRIAINATNTPGDADSLYKITQPGSYYLTGNITGVVGKHGIEIAASGVTLDLNGFDLVGVPEMGAFDGVSTTVSSLTNIAVINGSVRNWGDDGVDLDWFTSIGCRVEGVRASGNTGNGISVGTTSTVLNCSAYNNDDSGITANAGSTVSNCTASSNALHGISTTSGGTVSNCSAAFNTFVGISVSTGSTVSNCSAYQNTTNGISTGNGCTVVNCSTVFNVGSGITAGSSSTVEGCTSRSNTLHGITCTAACVIRGNTCSSNGNGGDGAGILATGSDNRIEGNNCIAADRGIDVDSAGNIIIRNTCSNNATNWVIAAGNSFLIVQANVTASNFSGNAGGGGVGSTDPHANFSY